VSASKHRHQANISNWCSAPCSWRMLYCKDVPCTKQVGHPCWLSPCWRCMSPGCSTPTCSSTALLGAHGCHWAQDLQRDIERHTMCQVHWPKPWSQTSHWEPGLLRAVQLVWHCAGALLQVEAVGSWLVPLGWVAGLLWWSPLALAAQPLLLVQTAAACCCALLWAAAGRLCWPTCRYTAVVGRHKAEQHVKCGATLGSRTEGHLPSLHLHKQGITTGDSPAGRLLLISCEGVSQDCKRTCQLYTSPSFLTCASARAHPPAASNASLRAASAALAPAPAPAAAGAGAAPAGCSRKGRFLSARVTEAFDASAAAAPDNNIHSPTTRRTVVVVSWSAAHKSCACAAALGKHTTIVCQHILLSDWRKCACG
jgi:hypothetical protein